MSLEQIYFFIKLLASLLVIGSMAGFGFYESMRLTQRLRLLKELYRMVMLLGSEIKYTALCLLYTSVALLKKNSRIVLLTATAETILERVKDSDDRPILNGHKDVDFIGALMEKRRRAYAVSYTHLRVKIQILSRKWHFREMCVGCMCLSTVSYTHLDVYKRQGTDILPRYSF